MANHRDPEDLYPQQNRVDNAPEVHIRGESAPEDND